MTNLPEDDEVWRPDVGKDVVISSGSSDGTALPRLRSTTKHVMKKPASK
jgi:hypothetical protein